MQPGSLRGTARPHPRLASDTLRSWISVTVPTVLLFVGVAVLLWIGPSRDLRYYTSAAFLALWAVFSISYIALTLAVFLPMSASEFMRTLRATRPGRTRLARFWWAFNGGGAIAWSLTGSAITLIALISLAVSAETAPAAVVWSGVVVVIASAALIVVSFAVSHARLQAERGGFEFPGGDSPRFADFLYLASQLSTTFGSNDVALTDTRARRAVAGHGAISWLYTSVLVALLVAVLLRVAG